MRSVLSFALLLTAPFLVNAAGLPEDAQAVQDAHRRHHARAPQTLSLTRRPLTRTTSTVKTTSSTVKTTSTSKTTSSTPIATPTSAISKKKGVSYNSITNANLFGNNVAWACNWFSAPEGNLPKGVEFNPMLWGLKDPWLLQIWDANAQAAIKNGSTHLLGFNEPDLGSESNLTVDQAVAAWRKYMEPYAGKIKLVAPAITNGGAPSGVSWMKAFLNACTGCHIDAVAMHWYDQAWNTGYFTGYFNDAIAAFSPKPIWITEFRGSGTAADQVKFINTVVPWMNKQAGIERYAIFGNYEGAAAAGNMITNGKLNEVGAAYRDAQ